MERWNGSVPLTVKGGVPYICERKSNVTEERHMQVGTAGAVWPTVEAKVSMQATLEPGEKVYCVVHVFVGSSGY